ncbi:MAG: hypothetical protein IPK20_25730 [Betaproteobacteria bacterium]|nr:hypothetical protein [Betaproteobacteria bacterium]
MKRALHPSGRDGHEPPARRTDMPSRVESSSVANEPRESIPVADNATRRCEAGQPANEPRREKVGAGDQKAAPGISITPR